MPVSVKTSALNIFLVFVFLHVQINFNDVVAEALSSNSNTKRSRQQRQQNTATQQKAFKSKSNRINANEGNSPNQPVNFQRELQSNCHTPHDILLNVGRLLTPQRDPQGRVASLAMIRLSKVLMYNSNQQYQYDEIPNGGRKMNDRKELLELDMDNQECSKAFTRMGQVLAQSIRNFPKQSDTRKQQLQIHDITIEGIKAAAIVARILSSHSAMTLEYQHVFKALVFAVHKTSSSSAQNDYTTSMEPHHLSGLVWALECLDLALRPTRKQQKDDGGVIPVAIGMAYQDLKLPFQVRPGFMKQIESQKDGSNDLNLTLQDVVSQVDFITDTIKTTTKTIVQERRQTAWQGEDHVPGFAYSGKFMPTTSFSPIVRRVQQALYNRTNVNYDCCLLNLYPNGGSGMRYHIDPDQGTLWGYDTCVVSVGASRRFAFREPDGGGQPHMFVVMDGDVTEMRADCQSKYQHTVKPAENKSEMATRSSLVFKKSLITNQ
jgi:alkylated DNA repair dioxygenase AlkB